MIIEDTIVNGSKINLSIVVSNSERKGQIDLKFNPQLGRVTMNPRQAIDMAAEIILSATKLLV